MNVGRLVAELVLDSARFVKGLNDSTSRVKKMSADVAVFGRNLSTTVTAPLVAAGVAVAKIGADFETALTKIETQTDTTRAQVAAWREDLLKLAPSLGAGPEELAQGLLAITSAGYTSSDALDVLVQSAKATEVGLGDVATIGRLLGSALNTWGKEGLTAARASDILFATIREGNVEAETLAPTLGRVLGIAKTMGVTFEEVGGFIATFTRLGVDAESAITALRATLSALLKPGKQAEKTLKEFGTSLAEVRKSLVDKGLTQTLLDLVKRFEGNDQALARVIPNVRALAGVLGTAAVQGETYRDVTADIVAANGDLERSFDRASQTTKKAWDDLRASLEVLSVRLADTFEKDLKDAIVGLSSFVGSLSEAERVTLRFAVEGAAALALLGPVLYGVAKAVGALVGSLSFLAAHPVFALFAGLSALFAGITAAVYAKNRALEAEAKAYEELNEKASSAKVTLEQLLNLHTQGLPGGVAVNEALDAARAQLELSRKQLAEATSTGGITTQGSFGIAGRAPISPEVRSALEARVAQLQQVVTDLEGASAIAGLRSPAAAAAAAPPGGGGGGGTGVSDSEAKKQAAALERLRDLLGDLRNEQLAMREGDFAASLAKQTAEVQKLGDEANLSAPEIASLKLETEGLLTSVSRGEVFKQAGDLLHGLMLEAQSYSMTEFDKAVQRDELALREMTKQLPITEAELRAMLEASQRLNEVNFGARFKDQVDEMAKALDAEIVASGMNEYERALEGAIAQVREWAREYEVAAPVVQKAIDDITDRYRRLEEESKKITVNIGAELAGAFRGTISGLLSGDRELDIGEQFKDSISGLMGEVFSKWLEAKLAWELKFSANLSGLKGRIGNWATEVGSLFSENVVPGFEVLLGYFQDWGGSLVTMIGGAFESLGKIVWDFVADVITAINWVEVLQAVIAGLRLVSGGVLGLLGFAEGGVVTRPTLGVFGEAGPEAVIPLDRFGDMLAAGGASDGGGGDVYVSISSPEAPVSTRTRREGRRRIIEAEVKRILSEDTARGGPVSKTQETFYGLKRTGVRR